MPTIVLSTVRAVHADEPVHGPPNLSLAILSLLAARLNGPLTAVSSRTVRESTALVLSLPVHAFSEESEAALKCVSTVVSRNCVAVDRWNVRNCPVLGAGEADINQCARYKYLK